jgi:hypothetical protein
VTFHVTSDRGGCRSNIASADTEDEAREIAKTQSAATGQREWLLLVTEVRDSGQRTKVVAYRRGRETSAPHGRMRR